MVRGSRKHVLDWTSRPEFVVELLQMVAPVHCRVDARSVWAPRGHQLPDEARLETFGPTFLPDSNVWSEVRRWWLVHEKGANTPNWDIAMGCEVDGQPGLILVEAKANVPELSALGKPLEQSASARSVENHQRIGVALDGACTALGQLGVPARISRDSHYQLSNRLGFAWRLASWGIPTVLVYLGFTGDDGIADVGEPFVDDAGWQKAFAAYSQPIVGAEAFERRIDCGAAPTWLLVRSRPVSESSLPRQTQRPIGLAKKLPRSSR